MPNEKVKTKKCPSRIRYEQNHPTIAFRLDKETKKRLKNVLEDKSFADFIKEALEVKEKEVIDLRKERSKSYQQGRTKGYNEAKNEYLVIYPCNVCGKYIEVNQPDEKAVAKKALMDRGWGHKSYHERHKNKEKQPLNPFHKTEMIPGFQNI